MDPHDSIAPFDREYTLQDLLSPEMVITWARVAPKLGVAHLSVVLPDGTPLATPPDAQAVAPAIQEIVLNESPEEKVSRETPQGWVLLYPLMHELEPAGYLALGFSPEGDLPSDEIDAAGTILSTAIIQIMKSGYGLAMASQVHGEVV